MSEQPSKTPVNDDEVDLSVVFKAIQNFFKSIFIGIINIIKFYWKHKIVLLILIVAGAIAGYFWEKSFDKTYKNQLLVIPNFESANYLYNKIESIESKLISADSVYLKKVFGENYEAVSSIEISPVVDVYNFVSLSNSNQELFELLFEEEASLEFLEDPINSRNYEYHDIKLSIIGEEHHEELSTQLLKYLNESSFFNSLQKITLQNLNLEISENEKMIAQVDSIINNSSNNKGFKFEDNNLSLVDNTGLKELLSYKKFLYRNNEDLLSYQIKQSKIINLADANYKVIDKDNLLKKSKIKLFPLIFILLYSLIFLLSYIQKKAKNFN